VRIPVKTLGIHGEMEDKGIKYLNELSSRQIIAPEVPNPAYILIDLKFVLAFTCSTTVSAHMAR
jgi:hypothetical protein